MFTHKEKISSLLLPLVFGAFLSVAFFVLDANAAPVAPAGTPTTTVLSAQSIQIGGITHGVNDSGLNWSFAVSTNSISRTIVNVSTPTTTPTFTFTGLATNTLYYLAVASGDGTATSSYVTSSAKYTFAETSLAPTLGAAATSSFPLVINTGGNPASTTYAILDTVSGLYLDQNKLPTSTAIYQTTSTWGASLAARGLSVNTQHSFVVIPRNGDGVDASIGAQTALVYTLANPAGTPTIGTPTISTLPITINVNGNPASTEFAIFNTTTANYLNAAGTSTSSPVWQTNSTWGTSFAAIGLDSNIAYQFVVIARNGDSVNAATSSASIATNPSAQTAASSGGSSGAIPVNSASQGGVPFNPSPAVSPAPIAVPPVSTIPTWPINPVVFPRTIFVNNLGVGSKGSQVTALQQKLRDLGFFKFPTNTGYYGSVTKTAVVAFQKKYNLKPYPGIVGPATRAKLNSL